MTDVKYKDSDKDGSTKVSFSVIEGPRPGGRYYVRAKLKVKKTGITGRGKGYGRVLLFDLDGKPIYNIKVSRTVGAELDGVAEKSDSKSVVLLPKISDKAASILFNCGADNSDGIVDTLSEILQNPTKVLELYKLVTDELDEIAPQFGGIIPKRQEINVKNGWSFVKLK